MNLPKKFKIEHQRQRIIQNLATIHTELAGKNLLILGHVSVPVEILVNELDVNIRRIFLAEYLTVEFMVDTYFHEGFSRVYTSFSKEAFDGSWDFILANTTINSSTMSHAANEILQRVKIPLRIKEILLIPPNSSINL
jgi:hypothetical protein